MKTKNGNVKFILNLALEPKLWFIIFIRSVYKELHADHETGAADNK